MVDVNTTNATEIKGTEGKGTATVKRTKPSSRKAKEKVREILYPARQVELWLANSENGPITVEKAKSLLGWMDEDDHKKKWIESTPNADPAHYKFPGNHLLVDLTGKKVICTNNSRNRPFNNALALEYCQDIMNKHWADSRNGNGSEALTDNGDTVVLSRTGEVISGQHRLIGLIYASQALKGAGSFEGKLQHWKDLWKDEEPSFEGTIQYGVSDHPKVLRTVDQNRPRTFADVLFTDPTYTSGLTAAHKIPFARTVDMAIKFLWLRTGEKKDSFAPRRTNAEAGNWLDNHPTLKEIAVNVLNLNEPAKDSKNPKLSGYLSLGDIAGVWYLMATSASDGDEYRNLDERTEKKKNGPVNFERKDHAKEFWNKFANDDSFAPVRLAFNSMKDLDKGTTGGGHKTEKLAILCHCWAKFLAGEPFAAEDVQVKKTFSTEKKAMVISEWPSFGGIDQGPEKPKEPTHKPLKNTDIDAVMAEAQAEGEDDEEIPFDEDEPSQEELDAIREDEEAVNEAHANRAAAVEQHNAEVLKEVKPATLTPATAFAGWDEESKVDPEPRKGRKPKS